MPLTCMYMIYMLSIVIKTLSAVLTITKTFHIQTTTGLDLKIGFPFIVFPDFVLMGTTLSVSVLGSMCLNLPLESVSPFSCTALFGCYHCALP